MTTGRATGNMFMICSVAMRCLWPCGVCFWFIELTGSYLQMTNSSSLVCVNAVADFKILLHIFHNHNCRYIIDMKPIIALKNILYHMLNAIC